MQAQLRELGPFFGSRKISDPFHREASQATLHRASSVLQEFTSSLDSRVEFLTTERISSLYEQLVAGISSRGSTFRSPPMHFNPDPPTFSYSSAGFLFIHRFIPRISSFRRLSLYSVSCFHFQERGGNAPIPPRLRFVQADFEQLTEGAAASSIRRELAERRAMVRGN